MLWADKCIEIYVGVGLQWLKIFLDCLVSWKVAQVSVGIMQKTFANIKSIMDNCCENGELYLRSICEVIQWNKQWTCELLFLFWSVVAIEAKLWSYFSYFLLQFLILWFFFFSVCFNYCSALNTRHGFAWLFAQQNRDLHCEVSSLSLLSERK